jgi:threonine/homoserine/homoserine lactone efflux protein
MALTFLLKGLIIGFSIAAPVGPIGLLCIQRTLARGRAHGLASGLGAATADATYGLLAAFGVTWVAYFLREQQFWIRLIGGIFLLYLGVRTLLSKPAVREPASEVQGLLGAYGSTLLLTLTNPLTVLSFAGIFAGLGIGATRGDYGTAGLLVLGVFLGSALWWVLLSTGVGFLRWRLWAANTDFARARPMVWINRISGAIIIGFGVWALATLVGK